jgi:hypothetical protein
MQVKTNGGRKLHVCYIVPEYGHPKQSFSIFEVPTVQPVGRFNYSAMAHALV